MTLRIGISARLLHDPPPGVGLPRKPLQFLDSSVAHWIMAHHAIALMVPCVDAHGAAPINPALIADTAQLLDGLVLQGGIDVCPEAYGQAALRPEWRGDPVRDRYELTLLRSFLDAGKPVLGVCRGAQLINVYHGGTLVQDIPSQRPGALAHEDSSHYDRLLHEVEFVPGSVLGALYPQAPRHCVTSLHHQCVDRLGEGLVVEATSPGDGIIEAIRHQGPGFVMGVQWHPEFHLTQREERQHLLDSGPIMQAFLDAARARADRHRAARAQSGLHG